MLRAQAGSLSSTIANIARTAADSDGFTPGSARLFFQPPTNCYQKMGFLGLCAARTETWTMQAWGHSFSSSHIYVCMSCHVMYAICRLSSSLAALACPGGCLAIETMYPAVQGCGIGAPLRTQLLGSGISGNVRPCPHACPLSFLSVSPRGGSELKQRPCRRDGSGNWGG